MSDGQDEGEVWIDPALAHLYADADDGFDDAGEPIEIPHRPTSLDELVEAEAAPDSATTRDVEELALLVEEAHRDGTSSDELLAELGLGEFRTLEGEEVAAPDDVDDGVELFFDLNPIGVAVTRRIAERAGLIPR